MSEEEGDSLATPESPKPSSVTKISNDSLRQLAYFAFGCEGRFPQPGPSDIWNALVRESGKRYAVIPNIGSMLEGHCDATALLLKMQWWNNRHLVLINEDAELVRLDIASDRCKVLKGTEKVPKILTRGICCLWCGGAPLPNAVGCLCQQRSLDVMQEFTSLFKKFELKLFGTPRYSSRLPKSLEIIRPAMSGSMMFPKLTCKAKIMALGGWWMEELFPLVDACKKHPMAEEQVETILSTMCQVLNASCDSLEPTGSEARPPECSECYADCPDPNEDIQML